MALRAREQSLEEGLRIIRRISGRVDEMVAGGARIPEELRTELRRIDKVAEVALEGRLLDAGCEI
jgi:hypothetical protein